jgi:hypothetical protein
VFFAALSGWRIGSTTAECCVVELAGGELPCGADCVLGVDGGVVSPLAGTFAVVPPVCCSAALTPLAAGAGAYGSSWPVSAGGAGRAARVWREWVARSDAAAPAALECAALRRTAGALVAADRPGTA